MATDAFGVDRDSVSKGAAGELIHVGRDAVGHGLGDGAAKAKKMRDGAFKIASDDKPKTGWRSAGVKVTVPKQNVAIAGLATGVAGINEVDRRVDNHRGANISVADQYLHPIKSGRQASAAIARQRSQKLAAKGKTRQANEAAYVSTAYNNMARSGMRGGFQQTGRYDKNKTYTPPAQIGKSAFGVEHQGLS